MGPRARRRARAAPSAAVTRALAGCRRRPDANPIPVLVETVKTYATIGEICAVLREVFGEYRTPQVY